MHRRNPWYRRALRLPALALAFWIGAARAQTPPPPPLEDGTWRDQFVLENGLRVVARNVPTTGHVAVAVCFPVGIDHDPKGREGMARLMSEIYLTGAAGTVPERTRAELDRLRPAGWGTQVSAGLTLFTEVVTPAQLPQVLRESAARMGGVRIDAATLKRCREAVTADLAEIYYRDVGTALHYAVRDLARLRPEDETTRQATGKGLDGVSTGEAQQRLASHYGPRGAVLSLAGDFKDIDLHQLIGRYFGALPANAGAPPLQPVPLRAASRYFSRASTPRPAGVVGVIAPALEDSLHPGFYAAAVILGSAVTRAWGRPTPPLHGRFEYSLFDDATLVRFYPPPGNDSSGKSLVNAFRGQVGEAQRTLIPEPTVRGAQDILGWLLGGPLSPAVMRRAQSDPSALATLANNAAVRELWGGETFWNGYRERFDALTGGKIAKVMGLFADSARQVVLQYNPRPERPGKPR